jgi:oxygen-independent coproporphyrinogen-3 oxidase
VTAPRSLYVHVPFCRARCRYCEFHTNIGSAESMDDYVRAVAREMELLPFRLRPRTLFLGGGTPTALPPPTLALLLDTLAEGIDASRIEEFTCEVNPGTLTPSTTDHLLSRGVNRVSVGVQSFHDRYLRLLGRVHDAATAHGSLQALRHAGVRNLGIDLILGIPGMTPEEWRHELDEALSHEPEHLSVYALSIEAGTTFARWIREGRLADPDDDRMADLYETTHHVLSDAGYEHYEISNFARPGFRCLHNVATWRQKPYAALGPAAASFIDGERRRNVCSTAEYVRRLRHGQDPVDMRERLDPERAAGEMLMLGLRTSDGITAGEVRRRHGIDPLERYREPLERHAEAGLLTVRRNRIRLTLSGWLVADEVLAELVVPERRSRAKRRPRSL